MVLIVAARHENQINDAGAKRLHLLEAADHLGAADVVHSELGAKLRIDFRDPDIRHGKNGIVLRNERNRAHHFCGDADVRARKLQRKSQDEWKNEFSKTHLRTYPTQDENRRIRQPFIRASSQALHAIGRQAG